MSSKARQSSDVEPVFGPKTTEQQMWFWFRDRGLAKGLAEDYLRAIDHKWRTIHNEVCGKGK